MLSINHRTPYISGAWNASLTGVSRVLLHSSFMNRRRRAVWRVVTRLFFIFQKARVRPHQVRAPRRRRSQLCKRWGVCACAVLSVAPSTRRVVRSVRHSKAAPTIGCDCLCFRCLAGPRAGSCITGVFRVFLCELQHSRVATSPHAEIARTKVAHLSRKSFRESSTSV